MCSWGFLVDFIKTHFLLDTNLHKQSILNRLTSLNLPAIASHVMPHEGTAQLGPHSQERVLNGGLRSQQAYLN